MLFALSVVGLHGIIGAITLVSLKKEKPDLAPGSSN